MDEKYKNTDLSASTRADDLLSRMSLEQKIAQLQCYMGNFDEKEFPDGMGAVSMILQNGHNQDVARKVDNEQKQIMEQTEFSIPALFHAEALTGGVFPDATSYPSAVGQASTWEPELIEKMAETAGKQMQAVGVRQGFAPVLDVCRDLRWGRTGESFGEDPTLCAAMGTAVVRGLQKDNKVVATAKHFVAYPFCEGGLNAGTCDIPERRLREVSAKPFQAAISEAGLKSVMNSYGSVNGEPVVTSKKILTDLLRDEMKFKGFVISDYMSVMHPFKRYLTAETTTDGGVQALTAGLDIEAPYAAGYQTDGLIEKVKNGELDPAVVDAAVHRILEMKFSIGLFDSPYADRKLLETEFNNPEYERISLQIAEKSLVLLKNDGILPLENKARKIAVIGPHAASCRMLFGGYSYAAIIEVISNLTSKMGSGMAGVEGDISDISFDLDHLNSGENVAETAYYPGSKVIKENVGVDGLIRYYMPEIKTLEQQLREFCRDSEITWVKGFDVAGTDRSEFAEALAAAGQADTVIVTVGGKYGSGVTCTTGEGADAANINLPQTQEEFLKELGKLGKRYIAIHFDGRPVSSDELDRSAAAILEAWSPARYGAKAIVNTLFGDNNPAGRLPITVPRCSGQIPVYYAHENGCSYDAGMDLGFGGYYDETFFPRYYFGYGLSYTQFEYSNLVVHTPKVKPEESVIVSVDIENCGDLSGEEVVQMYVADVVASMIRPVMELAAFKRIALQPGERRTLKFSCRADQFAFLDNEMQWKVESGGMRILIGAASNDIRLTGEFHISEDGYTEGSTRGFYGKAVIV